LDECRGYGIKPVFHGSDTADRLRARQVVPYDLGQRLFEAAPGPKQFVTIVNVGHNDPWSDEFHKTFDGFLAFIATSNHPLPNAGTRR